MDWTRSNGNSVLEEVKQNIPTIEIDFSMPEKDEAIAIYQRPAGPSLAEITEDLNFSEEDPELVEQLKPTSLTKWSDNYRQLDGNKSIENSAWTLCSGTKPRDSETKMMPLTDESKLGASLKSNVNNTYRILSFARLDQWDLDEVLKNMKDDNFPMQKFKSPETMSSHADADNKQSEVNILEKLAAFCMNQSVTEPLQKSHCLSQNNVCNKSLAKMQTELQLNHQERPTVYLDLRCPDSPMKAARKTPNISSNIWSKLPGKRSAERETPPAKERDLKEHPECQIDGREMTGKSELLQKMRAMKRNVKKYPDKCTDHPEEEMRDKPPHSLESLCSHDSHHLVADKPSSPLQSRKSKMESPANVQHGSIKEPKQQSDQQEEHMKAKSHHQPDQEILKQLENHHPAKSVNLKQPAAEKTDFLFEFEVSYQESISVLPDNTENEGCVLLTVSLLSPGMVGGMDAAHGGKKMYPSAAKSHIYNTLVAWFLSLAGPDSRHTEDGFGAEIPFRVAGLQQMWTKNGLALHVLAVDHHHCTSKDRDAGIHATFWNNICRFLSNTSLTAVASWLPQLKNLLDQQPFASCVHLPSSCLNCFISANPNKKVIDRIFSLSPGFYWLTVETQEPVFKGKETTQELHTEVSVVVGCSDFFQQPLTTHYTLHLILDLGLDVCGLRLLYPPQGLLSESGSSPVHQNPGEPCQPVLALAVRGPHAHSLLKNLTSSLHGLLHKKTEEASVKPLDWISQKASLIRCPQLASEVHRELCLWFSGRLQRGNAQNHNQHLNRVATSDKRVRSLFDLNRSSLLCATTKADLLLLVSPGVPPGCYGQVLATCANRGFSLMGLRRLQLNTNAATVLGLTRQQMKVFCSPLTSTPDEFALKLPSHCLVLLLRKENMLRHRVTLPSALMRDFQAQKLLGCVHFWAGGDRTVEPSLCFHTVPYNHTLLHIFVRCMWAVPKPSNVILTHQKCPSQSGVNQTVTLALCGKDVSQNLKLLHRVLAEVPKGDEHAKFELLGLKWMPVLTQLQAQELSPYEVGERFFCVSVDKLMSSPALVCVLRGRYAFSSMRSLLQFNNPNNLTVLMSPTPEVALRQVSLFFFERELIPGERVELCRDRQMQLTVCLSRPRVWNLALAKMFCKLQQCGLTMVALQVVTRDKSDVTKGLLAEGEQYLCPGFLALCLQGENAVKRLLDMLGQEDSSPWLSCYGPASYLQAIKDLKALFPEGLCCTETSTMRQEQIPSLSSDPVASVEHRQSSILNVAQEGLVTLATSSLIGGSFTCRASWQTTCLLIPLKAPPHGKVSSQLEIVEMLLKSGCHLVAGRMSILDDEQRKHIAETLAVSSSGREKMAHLSTALCLIIALQGEKIVAGLKAILESIFKEKSDLKQEERNIVYPEREKEVSTPLLSAGKRDAASQTDLTLQPCFRSADLQSYAAAGVQYDAFHQHARMFTEPVIVHQWTSSQNDILQRLSMEGKTTVGGDTRADSAGQAFGTLSIWRHTS